MRSPKEPRSARRFLPTIIVAACALTYLALGGFLLLFVPAALLQNWLPDSSVEEQGKLLGVAAQIVLFGLGGVIAIVGVALSVLRHQQELTAAARDSARHNDDRERELRARFVTAVDLLSADRPIKRTAALYALGALADDWDGYGRDDEVQVCIDVICGYLRAPAPEGTKRTPLEEIAVKTTGFSLINAHLLINSPHSWRARRIDLSQIHLDLSVAFRDVVLDRGGKLILDGAVISHDGQLILLRTKVKRGGLLSLQFVCARENGKVVVNASTVCDGGRISMDFMEVTDGGSAVLNSPTVNAGGRMSMSYMSIYESTVKWNSFTIDEHANLTADHNTIGLGGKLQVSTPTIHDDGLFSLSSATIINGGSLYLNRAKFYGSGSISLLASDTSDGGMILLDEATVIADKLRLKRAKIDADGPIELPSGDRLVTFLGTRPSSS